jgi:hypothetical protein
VSIVELSFNAIERSFQFYLVEMTAAESSGSASVGSDLGLFRRSVVVSTAV